MIILLMGFLVLSLEWHNYALASLIEAALFLANLNFARCDVESGAGSGVAG